MGNVNRLERQHNMKKLMEEDGEIIQVRGLHTEGEVGADGGY